MDKDKIKDDIKNAFQKLVLEIDDVKAETVGFLVGSGLMVHPLATGLTDLAHDGEFGMARVALMLGAGAVGALTNFALQHLRDNVTESIAKKNDNENIEIDT